MAYLLGVSEYSQDQCGLDADHVDSGQVTGWEGLIRVDNETYQWMGASNQSDVFANQTAFRYTSTRSIFTLAVGGIVEMNVTFLSPVTPDDMLRMSLPYS